MVVRISLYIQPESEKGVSVLWSGSTYNFRKVLDEAGVSGAYIDEDAGTRKYYRCLRSIDITSDPNKVEDIIKNVFNDLAMKVIIESNPIEDSDVADWIADLRKLEYLHFEK